MSNIESSFQFLKLLNFLIRYFKISYLRVEVIPVLNHIFVDDSRFCFNDQADLYRRYIISTFTVAKFRLLN